LKNMKLRFAVKNIKSIDNKNVEVVYDIKMKDFDKALEGTEKNFEENVRTNVLKKSGYKSEDEIEALMVKNGNESEKVRIYDIMVDEILDIMGKALENTSLETVISANEKAVLTEVNGQWELSELK
jgi:hypothetical protein